ncbi:MAG: hypothetical protein LBC68_10195, partial [Prevotellaceae bacterium]|nr:hypothetical protein [Prevotellaceae bacterium]
AWFVGLKKLLYQRAGEVNAWNEVTSTIYTEKNSSLNFKVEKNPTSAELVRRFSPMVGSQKRNG